MKHILSLTSLIILITSCSDDALNTSDFVAGEVFTNSNSRVIQIDTMTIEMSTIKFDSIITSNTERLLIGTYEDAIFGKVSSSSYMGVLPSSYTIDNDAKFDSIAFYIKYDEYYYNDTLQTNTIHLKKLENNFKTGSGDDDNFYNTSNVKYAEEDLGLLSYLPRPFSSDSIEIKINDDYGKDLFDDIQQKIITNNEEFIDKYKGVAFVPDSTDNGSIVGFGTADSSAYMRLYFSVAEADDIEQSYIDFTLNDSNTPTPLFNKIEAVAPIEYLKTLTSSDVTLNSSESDNQTYIQSGLGIATKINFPYLKSITNINGKGTLLNAVLKIKPLKASYNNHVMLKDDIAVYTVNKNNELLSQLYDNGSGEVNGLLTYESEEFNELYYEIPLTSYVENIITTEANNTEALLLIPSDYTTTVNRFILNGSNSSTATKTILELTYAIYDENE